MTVVKKRTVLSLVTAVLLLIAVHLLLQYRSKQVFTALIGQLSKGAFKADADEVDISYSPFGVDVRGFRMSPTSNESNLQKIQCDLLSLHIESVFQFVFERKLDLDEFEAVRPSVTINGTRNRQEISRLSISGLQKNLFELFNLLKAEKVRLDDCAFRIDYSKDTADYFSINHFSLSLDSFRLEEKNGSVRNPFQGQASFTMTRPEIHVSDPNISIGVHEVSLDKSSRALKLDSLEILVKDEEMRYEGIRLASITIKDLDWPKFLEEGRIDIDSALILSGSASLNLSKSEQGIARKNKKRKPYNGNPITIHHVAIKDISYALLMNDYMGKKDNKVLFSIEGEKFEVEDLRLDPEKKPALSAREIDVRLKDYKENDVNESYSVSLGSVNFKNGDLTMRDYMLKPRSSAEVSANNKVSVPELRVEGLSLEEMLMKRMDARRLVVVGPEVVIDLKRKTKTDKPKETPDESLRRILNGLDERVAVGNIILENGSLRLQSTDSSGQDIVISGVALNLSGSRIVHSRTINEALRSIDEFRTNQFSIKGPAIDLSVTRLKWLRGKSGLRFERVIGSAGNSTKLDLHGMELDFKSPVIGKNGVFQVSELSADSGSIIITGNRTAKNKKAAVPLFSADRVRLDNIDVTYKVEKKFLATSRIDIDIDDLSFADQKKIWSRISLSGIKNLFKAGEIRIEADEIDASQPGSLAFIGMKGSYVAADKEISFSTNELRIDGRLETSNVSTSEIGSVFMDKPIIEASIRIRKKSATLDSTKKASLALPAIPRLELVDPKFTVTVIRPEGDTVTRSKLIDGRLVLDSLRFSNTGHTQHLLAKHLVFDSHKVSAEIGQRYFNPAMLYASISNLDYDLVSRKTKCRVDKLRVQDFHHTIINDKNDTTDLSGDLSVYDWEMTGDETPDWKEILKSRRWNAERLKVHHRSEHTSFSISDGFASHDRHFRFGVGEMAFQSRGSREEFWGKSSYERDYMKLVMKDLECDEADIDLTGNTPGFDARTISIGHVVIRPERDKTRMEDTVGYRPLLSRQLTALPFPISIDSVKIKDGVLEYHEIGQRTGKEGVLSISRLNGYVANIRNKNLETNDTLVVHIRGLLYGQGNMRLHFRQSYSDSLQAFWMRMRLADFDMSRMNTLLSPLMRIELVSGRIDTMTILVKGNDHFSFGTIDMRFNDLFVCMRSDGKKRGFLHRTADWAANLYIRNTDNGKPSLLFRKRVKKRGQFNYWGKIAVEGLLSDIGIKRDDAERNAFEKAIRNYELPTDYWSEE